MKIIVERTFELNVTSDKVGVHKYFGSTMKEVEVSEEFIEWLKDLTENNMLMEEDDKFFQEEVGHRPEYVANIIIEGAWYKRKLGTCWIKGFYKKDDKSRKYEEITKEGYENYQEHLDNPQEEGPYGGAFRNWEDFYRMKGVTVDKR